VGQGLITCLVVARPVVFAEARRFSLLVLSCPLTRSDVFTFEVNTAGGASVPPA
jgi:hypothetical protein